MFTIIKKGSGTSFWCTFPVWFFHKNVFHLILYQLSKFQCHTFFLSRDIKWNVLSSYLDSWWRHELLRFILVQALRQWLTGRERGEDENTKMWISWERKELFRWNKTTSFIVFEGLSFGEKQKFVKKWRTQALNIFLIAAHFKSIKNNIFPWRPANLFKTRLQHRCFPVNIAKFFRTAFL